MVEIAKRNGVGKQYVSRLIRLAFLAPEMVERIAAGRQPLELTAQALRSGRFDIPVDWVTQKRASDLGRRPEHALSTGRPATTFFCSTSNARSIYKLSPPTKVQTERNLQNSGLNPDETSSLVDLERRIPAKCGFVSS